MRLSEPVPPRLDGSLGNVPLLIGKPCAGEFTKESGVALYAEVLSLVRVDLVQRG